MMELIAKPFGWVLLWLNNLVGNDGVAIFLFARLVKLIMLPFQFKSKKSMMRMSGLSDRVKELQKKHEGNQQRMQMEINKLYKEEKVSPMSGCLWTLIPFPILIALYRAIREPLTIMMGVPKELLAEGGSILAKLNEMGFVSSANEAYVQLDQSRFISANFDAFSGLSEKLININYNFLGINLGDMPKLMFWNREGFTWSDPAVWLPALGLFLVPVISALFSWLSMKLSQKLNPTAATAGNNQQAATMKSMNLLMPLMSLYICFIMPAALGIYWIYQSILGVVQELVFNKHFGKIMAREQAEREKADRIRAAEIERKRQETERLKAEGATVANSNTSKKKIQARQKAEMDEIKAAAIREEKAARRARLGIEEEEVPASQVGNRRYARGRAYVPDRYTNPANAAAATEKAAAESEGYVAPEETETELSVAETPVEETVVDTAPKAQAEEEEEEEVFFVEEDSDETSN
ncbi:MAG: membrane protein insertase YidC [Oscillospiraceae bacterium]|nr:membrane protein insertase YidC [Oscillospiraceae bacterium]